MALLLTSRVVMATTCLVLLVLVPATSGRSSSEATPSARVGAIYFDGWACPLSNFHFDGLVRPGRNGQFPERRPLSGWRDHTRDAMTAQLRWAHADGIDFFLFDWYREGIDPCLNVAHDNYLKLADRGGVDFAVLYVNHEPFGIPPDQWAAASERWVTEDFLDPDYVRIAGKPLFVVLDTTNARLQWGGPAGVNSALEVLQATARRHGLPGVFVVGGRYTDWLNTECFPICDGTDGGPGGLATEHYDALTEYGYALAVEPVDGPRPYNDLVTAKKIDWQSFAARSPIPYLPSISSWDARPWDSRPLDRLFWFTRSPREVGAFLSDAAAWVRANPPMQVEPASAPPVVLIQSWNEVGEGSYIVPTDADGYSYGQAIAEAVGIPWTPPPKRTLRASTSPRGTVTSKPAGISCSSTCTARFDEGWEVTLSARASKGSTFDGWAGACTADKGERACAVVLVRDATVKALVTAAVQRRRLTLTVSGGTARGRLGAIDSYSGCATSEPVQIQRQRGARWTAAGSTVTDGRGGYAVTLQPRPGMYRAIVPRRSFNGHTCLAAVSRSVQQTG